MLQRVRLVPHSLEYAQRIFTLVTAPQVSDALGFRNERVEETEAFIRQIVQEEAEGRSLSRVVQDENGQIIGITTLMKIDREQRRCHIGSWLGYEFWGKGYNQEAKFHILKIAFTELDMQYVFVGARSCNIRSQKAQEKLPYMTLHAEGQFPEEHAFLETKEKQPCVLNVVCRDDFLKYAANIERSN